MKRLVTLCVLVVAVFLAAVAHADTVTLNLVSAYNNDGQYYTYPYMFKIDNGPSLVALICDDFRDDVTFGETWTANRVSVTQAGINNFMGVSNSAFVYKEAAWLYGQAVGHESDSAYVTAINHAIWKLMDPSAPNFTDIGTWLTQAATGANNEPASYFDQFVFYTYAAGTPISPSNSHIPPQEYIGKVPEPSSLILLASGLLAGIGTLRRRFMN